MFTFMPTSVSVREFVTFWAPQYPVKSDNSSYLKVIDEQPLNLENLHALFKWKAGSQFSGKAKALVDAKYSPLLDEMNALPLDFDGKTFVEKYGQTGAIWSIFLLHCWQPEQYPIYDQNVHRAMRFITSSKNQDFEKWSDKKKLDSYFNVYLPFYQQFRPYGMRDADRALFMCGKFLKTSKFPNIVKWREDFEPKSRTRKN